MQLVPLENLADFCYPKDYLCSRVLARLKICRFLSLKSKRCLNISFITCCDFVFNALPRLVDCHVKVPELGYIVSLEVLSVGVVSAFFCSYSRTFLAPAGIWIFFPFVKLPPVKKSWK